jgi:R3H-associated N-terminal domain
MAIYPETASGDTFVHIEAWVEGSTLQALNALSLSESAASATTNVRGTAVTLEIPLDDHHGPQPQTLGVQREEPVRRVLVPRRVSSRDSLKRREALLKGKEGSRRRQRWENGSFQASWNIDKKLD